jgi:transposase
LEDEVKTLGRAIGLDVHLQFCEVAIVEAGVIRSAGRIETTPEKLELFAQSLSPADPGDTRGDRQRVGDRRDPQTTRRQGRRGELCRHRDPPGARQTDRLDARTLARLLWSGELDPVWMPDEQTKVLRRRLSRREQRCRSRTRAATAFTRKRPLGYV